MPTSAAAPIYQSAAPEIRALLVIAVQNAHNAKTQRDRMVGYGQAFAYASALRIMATSADQSAAPDGVAAFPGIASGAVAQARDWLKTDADLILGKVAG